jgi:hypothetical protein
MHTATATKSACACSCNPCSCPSPAGMGCQIDACPPRPCFFDGQLITADDLNAMMTYVRTKEAIFARLVSGWGVLGGMRVDAGPGTRHLPLAANPFSPNPQIVAGTLLSIGAGVAADVRGNVMSLCRPAVIDALQLAQANPTTPQERLCNEWFSGRSIEFCGSRDGFSALDYLVVAVYRERPARPVPQFSGGGACDPAPGCDFSRTLEDVEIRLVPTMSLDLGQYLVTGCLDRVAMPFKISFDIRTGAVQFPELPAGVDHCAVFDALNEIIVGLCCERPAVVLGRIIITSTPGKLGTNLPQVPLYTIIQDFLPIRRVVVQNAMHCMANEGRRQPEPVPEPIPRTDVPVILGRRDGGPTS